MRQSTMAEQFSRTRDQPTVIDAGTKHIFQDETQSRVLFGASEIVPVVGKTSEPGNHRCPPSGFARSLNWADDTGELMHSIRPLFSIGGS